MFGQLFRNIAIAQAAHDFFSHFGVNRLHFRINLLPKSRHGILFIGMTSDFANQIFNRALRRAEFVKFRDFKLFEQKMLLDSLNVRRHFYSAVRIVSVRIRENQFFSWRKECQIIQQRFRQHAFFRSLIKHLILRKKRIFKHQTAIAVRKQRLVLNPVRHDQIG